MNRPKSLIIIGMILFLTGCTDFFMICSLNPFYLEKNITLVPEVEGSWKVNPVHLKSNPDKKEESAVWNQADTTSVWKIERVFSEEKTKNSKGKDTTLLKPMNYYLVKLILHQADSSGYQFRMVLFRVNKMLYADFMPVGNYGLEKSRFAKESYFTVHTLARVNLLNSQLDVSWLGAEYMKEMIEKKRVRVNYRWVREAGRLLLTGTSEELTGMIDRYADQPRFIDWENQPARLRLNHTNE